MPLRIVFTALVLWQKELAERLGLKRTTLQNKMRKLNINRAEYVS